MSVYKEGYEALRIIGMRTAPIFEDACDAGMILGDKNHPNTILVKQLVDWYGVPDTIVVTKYHDRHYVREVKVRLMDEWAVSDGRKTIEQATEVYTVKVITLHDKRWCEISY